MAKTITEVTLEICNMLTLSTAHIKYSTSILLEGGNIGLTVFPKGNYGWFIYVNDEDLAENKGSITEDLYAVVKLAHDKDCVWLCLDCDGETTDLLPTYDWDKED